MPEDPGWRPALVGSIPFYGLLRLRRKGTDGLTALRSTVIGLVTALFLFVVSLTYIVEGDGVAGTALLGVIGVGVVAHIVLTFACRRPLSTGSLGSLADSWRTRMFIGVGLAELPALIAFAAAIVSDSIWIYVVGMVFSLAGFWRIGPSKRNLAEDQVAIRSAGSPLDLTEALMRAGQGSYEPPS